MSGRAVTAERVQEPKAAPRHGGAAVHEKPVMAAVRSVLQSPGLPLDPASRARMERHFGRGFGHVRIHSDERAAVSAQAVGARAWAVGSHLAFARGAFAPHSPRGQRLLVHELAHVLQMHGGSRGALRLGGAAEAGAEAEAARWAAPGRGPGVPSLQHRVPGTVLLRQEAAEPEAAEEEEGPGFWGTLGGGLMGEFNEDPDFAMIGVDVGVSLVPILDQASDVRDIIAHLYYLVADGQYDRFMRWVGLVFTLIGLVPEVGSAIKGASKFVIRGVSEVLSHVGDLLRPFRALLPELADIGRLRRYVLDNWSRFVAAGRAAWDEALALVTRVFDGIPGFIGGRMDELRRALDRVRELAPTRMDEAFEWIRRQWDEVLTAAEQRLGLPAGGLTPDLAGAGGHGGSMHMSSMGDEFTGPRSTGDAIDDLEATMRGSRTADPRDLSRMAEAGRRIEPGAVADWARRLGRQWQVMVRADWPAWVRRRFPSGGPDMVAINHAERRILVGDVAPSAASRVDVRAGTGLGAPASMRRGAERELGSTVGDGTMLHFEKTLDDARRVAAGLPRDMRDFVVLAQEYWWEGGRQMSRMVQVYP